jgi:hypothetical protein
MIRYPTPRRCGIPILPTPRMRGIPILPTQMGDTPHCRRGHINEPYSPIDKIRQTNLIKRLFNFKQTFSFVP